jgi:hypothetical protein
MKGGEISGNTGWWGVYLEGNAVFTMENGAISGNTAGGVDVGENATFTMEGGTISDNTAEWGGGVWVGGTFTKKGGTIYGDTDTTHTPGSTENTSTNGHGHAVGLNNGKKRNADADPTIKLYAKYVEGSGWTYDDIGGVGDTTANWE